MTPSRTLRKKNIARFLEVSSQYFSLPGLLRSLLIAGSIGATVGGEAIANPEREPTPTTENRSGSDAPAEIEGFRPHRGQPPIETMP